MISINYKGLYCLEKTNFSINCLLDPFSNKVEPEFLDEADVIPNNQTRSEICETLELHLMALNSLGLAFSENKRDNISIILRQIANFKNFDFEQMHQNLLQYNTYGFLASLLVIDQSTLSYEIGFDEDQNNVLSLLIIMKMVQKSLLATQEFMKFNIFELIYQNEPLYSQTSKKLSLYIISNMLFDMEKEDLRIFQKNDLVGKTLFCIENNTTDLFTQTAAYHLLFALVSSISKISKISLNIVKKIYDEYLESAKPEGRFELFRALYSLCLNDSDLSFSIYMNNKLAPFINSFRSANPDMIEISLNFFYLLFMQANDEGAKFNIINSVPWDKLLIRLEEAPIWCELLVSIVDQTSINSQLLNIFWEKGVFHKLLSFFDGFPCPIRFHICKALMDICNRIAPNECIKFIENNVFSVFFNVLESDNHDIANCLIDCLHIINEKMKVLNMVEMVLEEYKKNDAVSILQNFPDLEEKAKFVCIEIGLINEE